MFENIVNNLLSRQIVALLAQAYNEDGNRQSIYPETKIFLVDPKALTYQIISIVDSGNLYTKAIISFNIRNHLYVAGVFKESMTFYRFNVANQSMDFLINVPYSVHKIHGTSFILALPIKIH